MKQKSLHILSHLIFCLVAGLIFLPGTAHAWWNDDWSLRKEMTIDTGAAGAGISEPIGTVPVLVRLHLGNFDFEAAKEDGSDLRFVAGDDMTPLAFYIERYDSLLGEAFVWVSIPNLAPGAKTDFWLYYGNESASPAGDPAETYDPSTVLDYHFSERDQPIRDYTTWGNNAQSVGTLNSGSLIGSGLRLDGQTPISLPASQSLAWDSGAPVTWASWVKMSAMQPNATIFSRRDGAAGLTIGVDNGVPFVEIADTFGVQRTGASTPLQVESWHHLAVVADAQQTTLYVDGNVYATLNTPLPAMSSAALLGGVAMPAAPATGDAEQGAPADEPAEGAASPSTALSAYTIFAGEMDEMSIAKAARPAGFIQTLAISQGPEAGSLLTHAVEEETASWSSGYFGMIVRSVTLDAWVVIAILAVMAVVSWIVMADKAVYVSRQGKANDKFIQRFRELSSDLTTLDQHLARLSGSGKEAESRMVANSSLYRIYHIGSGEIRNRFGDGGPVSLSAESIAAIRAALDTGMVRESQRLQRLMVILTIAISGGPFLGLLGTVIGVMITFASIAQAGDVNVNAIAPGVAAALLATVAGLVVAIPALFGYNYLTTRIKNITSDMQVFADEFVTKLAEFYSGNPGSSPK